MIVQRVRISNFRGIEEKQFEFRPGFNLIKGENGKGKTSILEAVAVGLGGFVAGFDGVSTRHFSKQEIRRQYVLLGDGSYDERLMMPMEVEMDACIDHEEYRWVRRRSSVKAARSTVQPRKICKKAEAMALADGTELPVILYQSAARVWSQKRERSENVFRKNYYRTVGYMDALFDASNIKLLLNWCAKMEQVSWQKSMRIAEYEAVKRAVADFMTCMEQDGEFEIFYDKQREGLMLKKEETVLPVEDLSAGYQSLVWMVFDIAYRMAVLNPEKRGQISETGGVVLIDEIDMHLHPKWQWNIVEALRRVFPNVQFIATTHAPILFASAKNVWIIDIEGDEVCYSESHYGLDINTVLKVYQETEEVIPEVQKKVEHFYDLLDKQNYKEAEHVLRDLEAETAPAHPLTVRMRAALELEMITLEG